MRQRTIQVQNAIELLKKMRSESVYESATYAIDANLAFLRALKSFPKYLWWLCVVAPKLDGARLLELTDFPIESWDIAMHKRLIELQKRARPGLVAPLVDAIVKCIQRQSRDFILADLGAGGMEVDRQVIQRLLDTGMSHRLTVVAVDSSAVTRRIARANLADLGPKVALLEVGHITTKELTNIREKTTEKVLIVMCTNNIFTLDSAFPPKYFDLVYHSLFKHHLNPKQKEALDMLIHGVAKEYLEFDGYKNWPVMLPQTIVGWNYPHFLNGEVFSNLRFKTKTTLLSEKRKEQNITFYASTGFYLASD